jgi:hypothetical protein
MDDNLNDVLNSMDAVLKRIESGYDYPTIFWTGIVEAWRDEIARHTTDSVVQENKYEE